MQEKCKTKRKLVYGVGVNDADYQVIQSYMEGGKRKRWRCPYYVKWSNMLERGYSENRKAKSPYYKDVTVCKEWHTFSTFRAWMAEQDWEGKHLDKDLLLPGNREYGPNACCFVSLEVNCFMCDSAKTRGVWPIGVYLDISINRFRSTIVIAGKQRGLGIFDDPITAHETWRQAKIKRADELAAQEKDPRIATALMTRYRNYIDPWFCQQDSALAA